MLVFNITLAIAEGNEVSASAPVGQPAPISGGSNASRTPSGAARFPAFSQYKGGHLSRKQLEELAENATFLADADFWMDRNRIKFLSHTIGEIMQRLGRRMAVDQATREELFAIERDLDPRGFRSLDEQKTARLAHTTRTMLHDMGLIRYLPPAGDRCSSEGILHYVQGHPDRAFVVFTTDGDFGRLMMNRGITNVIPLVWLPGDDCKVPRDNLPMVEAFLNHVAAA